jgi:Midasin AAA lid domain
MRYLWTNYNFRDLLKWCERAALCYKKGNADSSLHILQDAIDIFCWAAPSNGREKIMYPIFHNTIFLIDERHRLACTAAGKLGIVSTKVDYFLREYKAHISATPSKFVAGRGQVKCVQNFAAGVKYDEK